MRRAPSVATSQPPLRLVSSTLSQSSSPCSSKGLVTVTPALLTMMSGTPAILAASSKQATTLA